MKKKALILLLSTALLLALLPASALAADSPSDNLPEAVGDVVTLDKDYSVTSLDTDKTYDLNGHTLTYTAANNASLTVDTGKTFTVKDSTATGTARGGTFEIKGYTSAYVAAVMVEEAGTVNVSNITINCCCSAFYPKGSAAAVNVESCDLTAACYCVATNANTEDHYGVQITLKNSRLTAANSDKDNCPVMLNVPGTLTIESCTIIGERQSVAVRAGTAVLSGSTVQTLGTYSDAATKYHSSDWSSGNEIPAAALTVGNYVKGEAKDYPAAAIVTVKNCTVQGTSSVPAIYADGNDAYWAQVTIDAATTVSGEIKTGQCKTEGQVIITREAAPAPSSTVEVTQNPDGSRTVTETAADGAETATTTWDDGTVAVAVKTPQGEIAVTVTAPDGQRAAEVSLPPKPDKVRAFEDVREGAWYESAVNDAAGYGLFSGTSPTTFSPDSPMTRGMLVTVLHNLSGSPDYGTGEGIFADVKEDAWYEDPVDWAYKLGVTSGTSATTFSPNRAVTREQLAAILFRYAGKIGEGSSNRKAVDDFPDAGEVSGYAREAVEWAAAEGILAGRARGGRDYIVPQDAATRAEVATVLARFVNYLKQ